MDQPGQASRTGRNGQEQFQVDDTLQNGLPVITDNRNEIFTVHRQDQGPPLLYHDTEQLPHASDQADVLERTVEMNPQATVAAITGTTVFQTMNRNNTVILPREQQFDRMYMDEINGNSNTNLCAEEMQPHPFQLSEQIYLQRIQYLKRKLESLRHQIAQELAHLPLIIMQHQQGRTFTFYLSSEGPTNIMNDESAIPGASATPTDDTNLSAGQMQPRPFHLSEQLYPQQIQYFEKELQSHQNAQELAHSPLLSMQHQQRDASTSHLPQEGRTNIVDGESGIPSASATPTDSYGENNSPTNFDGQDESLPTTLQSDGDSTSDNENGGSSSQDGHERRDTRKRSYCSHCHPNHPGFTRERDIKRHIVSVHNGQRHICGICGNSFSRIDGLNRHLRTHN